MISAVSVTMMSVSGAFWVEADLKTGLLRTRSGGGEWAEGALTDADRALLVRVGTELVGLGERNVRTQFADGEVHFVVGHAGGQVTWSFVTEGMPPIGAAEPLWAWACEAVR